MTQTTQTNGHSFSQLLYFKRESPILEPQAQGAQEESEPVLSLAPSQLATEKILGVVTHQLSRPFNVITGAAWSLKDECSPEDREFWIECILRNSIPAQNLIEDLRDELQLSSGQFEIQLESMNLAEVVSEAVEEFGPMAREYQLRFYGDTAWISGDVERIKRLVFNLLSNAICNTRVGREIKIDVWNRGERVCLFVQDQGQNEKPNENEQMFSSFSPIDCEPGMMPPTNPRLCSVKRIANAHGAAIRVQGTAGEGTIFEVEFKALDSTNHKEN